LSGIGRSTHSRRMVPISRSQNAPSDENSLPGVPPETAAVSSRPLDERRHCSAESVVIPVPTGPTLKELEACGDRYHEITGDDGISMISFPARKIVRDRSDDLRNKIRSESRTTRIEITGWKRVVAAFYNDQGIRIRNLTLRDSAQASTFLNFARYLRVFA